MGGVLKVMVMFASTGDFMVVMFELYEEGGGNCPEVPTLCRRRQTSVKRNAFDEAQNNRYAELAGVFDST